MSWTIWNTWRSRANGGGIPGGTESIDKSIARVIVQVLDDGAIRFAQPDVECFDSGSRPFGDWRQLPAVHERAGIHIDAKMAAMRGRGGPMDYGLAMDTLMYLRREISAET